MIDPTASLFVRVVETGSIKAAAAEIGADPSSVSRRIAALEARVGATLLHRSTRRSRPTEAGSTYYEGIRRLADEQAALEAQIAGLSDTPAGLLRVTAPVDFGARFVAPVLGQMIEAFPALTVDLQLGARFMDLREAGIDVAIRIGALPDSALIGRRLGSVPRVLVGSPGYIGARGVPKTLADLADHDFVFYRPAPGPLEIRAGSERVTVRGRIAVNGISAVTDLLRDGRGLHLGPVWAFEDDLAAGHLVAVLEMVEWEALPLNAVFLPARFQPAKIRRFIEAMRSRIRDAPSLRA